MSNQDPKRKRNKWLALTAIPIQMGATIFLFAWLGGWLDKKYSNPNGIYTKILVLAGVGVALFTLYRQVRELNKDDKDA